MHIAQIKVRHEVEVKVRCVVDVIEPVRQVRFTKTRVVRQNDVKALG